LITNLHPLNISLLFFLPYIYIRDNWIFPKKLAKKDRFSITSHTLYISLSSFVFFNVNGLFKKTISISGFQLILIGLLSIPRNAVSSSHTLKDIKEREKKYLNGSLEVHVSSLVRSLRVWIEVHLKVDAICIFC